MFGYSIFLGDDFSEDKRNYILTMRQIGFQRIFTSLHIPEDRIETLLENLKKLGSISKANDIDLMADISNKGLERLGIDLTSETDIRRLIKLGVTGLRIDFGIPMQTVAFISRHLTVALNASTLTESDVEQLKMHRADIKQMELWHNYYPRPETGLSKTYLEKINKKWQHLGIKLVAFVSSDINKRGPLHCGLPTLESHRSIHPLAGAIELQTVFGCQDVFIGDEGLSPKVQQQFATYINDEIITMEMKVYSEKYKSLFLTKHTNRIDDARDVVRSQEARFKRIPDIIPENTIHRSVGSVTLDNCNYLRYMGELQLIKKELPKDNKVNVVGKIIKKDQDLVPCILPGTKFELRKER